MARLNYGSFPSRRTRRRRKVQKRRMECEPQKEDEWKSKKRKWGEKRKAEPVTRCRRFCQEDPFEFHKAMLENPFSLKFSTMQ